MGIIETGSEIYYSIFKLSILFSFIFLIANSTFSFVDLSFIPQIDWDVADLNTAVSGLKNAKGLDIAVAIPMLIVKVFALMIQSFVNSILFINFIIYQTIYLMMLVLPISESLAVILANIISWIILAPALIGVITDIGRMIFYLLFGVKR